MNPLAARGKAQTVPLTHASAVGRRGSGFVSRRTRLAEWAIAAMRRRCREVNPGVGWLNAQSRPPDTEGDCRMRQ
jgi:hypothetical protein